VKASVSNFPKPQLARGWVIGLCTPLVALLLWMAWRSRSEIGPGVVFIGLLTIVSPGVLRTLSTTITDEGASQLTLRGRVRLRWEDVRQVRFGAYGALVLKGDEGRIVINCAFYQNFDATWTWLARRLQRVWPADEDA